MNSLNIKINKLQDEIYEIKNLLGLKENKLKDLLYQRENFERLDYEKACNDLLVPYEFYKLYKNNTEILIEPMQLIYFKKAKYNIVFLCFKNIPYLNFLIINAMKKFGINANYTLITSIKLRKKYNSIKMKGLKKMFYFRDFKSQDELSLLLTDIKFWNQFEEENILIVDPNIIINNNRLDEYSKKDFYINKKNLLTDNNISFRKKSKMLEIIELNREDNVENILENYKIKKEELIDEIEEIMEKKNLKLIPEVYFYLDNMEIDLVNDDNFLAYKYENGLNPLSFMINTKTIKYFEKIIEFKLPSPYCNYMTISNDYIKNLKLYLSRLNINIVSHGGVGSNYLCDYLQINGIRTKYDQNDNFFGHRNTCHFPFKLLKTTKTIYIYGDIINAIISQHNRNFLKINATKMNLLRDEKYKDINYFYKNFPEDPIGILKQYNNFKNSNNTYLLKYPYTKESVDKALNFFGYNLDLKDFIEIKRKDKSSDDELINEIIKIYSKYEYLI